MDPKDPGYRDSMAEIWDNRDKTQHQKPLLVWQADDGSGAWQIETPHQGTKRYTAFVKFVWPDAEGPDDYTLEEIDINARTHEQAKRIAQAVLDKDYEPGGRIIRTDERIGWYM